MKWHFHWPCRAMAGSLEVLLLRLKLQRCLVLPLCGVQTRRCLQKCSSGAGWLQEPCTNVHLAASRECLAPDLLS